ncbi:MAG: ABC transporter permease [Anaerolineaceae bacterium]|jgi:ABC-2 type transport system permease protein
MSAFSDMLWIEFRKTLRSRMPLFTVLGSLLMPLGISFLIFVSRNPDISRKLGLISAKANLMADTATNWPAYMNLFGQMIAAGGFFFFCLIISWVFGREFSDGTLKDMLAVPVPRGGILLAKFAVSAAWSAGLSLAIIVLGLGMGALIGLPQGSAGVILQGSLKAAIAAGLAIVVVMPFALLASIGRGYLLPVGVAILTMIMGNVVAIAGWGEYFPWDVPGLYSQPKIVLPATSYWVVLMAGLVGMAATYLWWKFADQSR